MGRNKYETNVQPRLEEIREWIGTMTEEQIATQVREQWLDQALNDIKERPLRKTKGKW